MRELHKSNLPTQLKTTHILVGFVSHGMLRLAVREQGKLGSVRNVKLGEVNTFVVTRVVKLPRPIWSNFTPILLISGQRRGDC